MSVLPEPAEWGTVRVCHQSDTSQGTELQSLGSLDQDSYSQATPWLVQALLRASL